MQISGFSSSFRRSGDQIETAKVYLGKPFEITGWRVRSGPDSRRPICRSERRCSHPPWRSSGQQRQRSLMLKNATTRRGMMIGTQPPLEQRCYFMEANAMLLRTAPIAAGAGAAPGGARYEPDDNPPPPGEPGKDYNPVITPNGATLPCKLVDGVKVIPPGRRGSRRTSSRPACARVLGLQRPCTDRRSGRRGRPRSAST